MSINHYNLSVFLTVNCGAAAHYFSGVMKKKQQIKIFRRYYGNGVVEIDWIAGTVTYNGVVVEKNIHKPIEDALSRMF